MNEYVCVCMCVCVCVNAILCGVCEYVCEWMLWCVVSVCAVCVCEYVGVCE